MRHERSLSTHEIHRACGDIQPTCALYAIALAIESTDTKGYSTNSPTEANDDHMRAENNCISCSDAVKITSLGEGFGVRAVIADSPRSRDGRCPVLATLDAYTNQLTTERRGNIGS